MSSLGTTHFRWDDMPKEKVNDLLDRRLVTGERMMLAHVYLKKGCIVPRHSHENEQVTYILEGALRFWLGEDEPARSVGAARGRGAGHPVEPAAQGGGAGGHARPRRLLPAAPGLARRHRRLPAAEVAWTSGCAGKVALVAGSSQGLGRAIAEELAAEGPRSRCARAGQTALEATARDAIAARSGSASPPWPPTLDVPDEARARRGGGHRAITGGWTSSSPTRAGRPPGPFESHDEAAWLAAVRLTLLRSAVELSARRAARDEGAPLRPHPQRHLDRGEAAGGRPHPLQRRAGGGDGHGADARQRDGAASASPSTTCCPATRARSGCRSWSQAHGRRARATTPEAVAGALEAGDPGRPPGRAARAGRAGRLPGLRARRLHHGQSIAVDGGWIRSLL